MSIFGVDYAWGRPGPSALKRAGAKFVCRYLSHDASGKNLTRSEADELSRAGLWLVVVWESTASRALAGRAAGIADATDAAKQARACGMPADRPIFFAVDFDATSGQQAAINAYLDGAAAVLGRARVGLYAGYGPIKRAFDAGKIRWGWQTYAWSGGRWDKRAQLQQYSNDHVVNGVGVDYDRAVHDDYGQWRVGVSPAPPPPPPPPMEEDDMPYGQLNNGANAVTPVSFPRGTLKAIGFVCDNGLQDLPPAQLRVAVHDAHGWSITQVTVDSTKPKTIVYFKDPTSTDGLSVQRSDDGQVNVAWDAS
ncbi:DUF1906 domain-containing protein [Actinomadura gamaensis]|uniref:DUF1906 domain-containing protein n=1 Tax=Actinomadura gamaensis TaxID=1763541 RepID=A0ABV9TWK9_9ACTN